MSTQHTPGPWWTTEHGIRDRGGYIAHTNSAQRYEGQAERYEREVAQREADKRLIAAAPRMSDALKRAARILAELPDQSPQLVALRTEIVDCIKQATPEYYGVQS